MKKIVGRSVLIAILFLSSASFLMIAGHVGKKAASQDPQEALVFFTIGKAPSSFKDLSPYDHAIEKKPGEGGYDVETVYDSTLGREVYSFINGGHLEIPDIFQVLKCLSSDEMTIEIKLKITDFSNNQIPLCKGKAEIANYPEQCYTSYTRNYGLQFLPLPGTTTMISNFIVGQITSSYSNPIPPVSEWKIYAYKIVKSTTDPNFMNIFCYENGQSVQAITWIQTRQFDEFSINCWGEYPPLRIGTGYSTFVFEDRPFSGYIDYVRIYKRLLSDSELNQNPYALPALPTPPNQPPMAVCKNITLFTGHDCFSTTIQASDIDGGSSDPDGDDLSLSIDNIGPFRPGTYSVTLTVSDGKGGTDSCDANITVSDITAPVIAASEPVCVPWGNGKGSTANKIVITAQDNCSSTVTLQITVEIYNNGGKLVNGNGIYEIAGNAVYVKPNGAGWSVKITVIAADGNWNTSTMTIAKPLLKC